MALYDYEEEVKSHVTSNIFKIAVPIITPLYLLFNISDWISFPGFALEFLYVRLIFIPVGAVCFLALRRKWPGPWHALTIWICALVVSSQMTYMAFRSGSLANSPYLYAINMMAAILLFLFPMQRWRNLITLLMIYLPPAVLFLFRFVERAPVNLSVALLGLYLIMIVILSVAATAVDRLRYKMFQQRVSLFYMATTDALSGLKLRRYFFNRFVQELSLRARKGREMALSVAMMDIDSFKSINDQYGHDVGDRCIRHIGELIRKNIRIYDVACRFGGEEFVILFPETKLEEARAVSERIRKMLEDSPLKTHGREVRVTLSTGISGVESEIPEGFKQALMGKDQKFLLIKHMMQMMKAADTALYEAKNRNKNCVVMGSKIEFTASLDSDEMGTLKSYLPYFDQSVFLLQPEEAGMPAETTHEDLLFYPEEYFFRRCVEGLYRWHRDHEWHEVLAIISIEHPDQEIIKKQFHKMFRLSDAASVLGIGVYGVLLYGMPSWALERVIDRIKKQLSAVTRADQLPIRIAAAALQFEGERDKIPGILNYAFFAKKVTEIFNHLKQHRFALKETVYYYEPARLPAGKA